MLDKEDLDSIRELVAKPMTDAMSAQKELLEEKLKGIGRSIDTIRDEQTTQVKHCQRMTREMTEFKVSANLRVENLEGDVKKKDRRVWAIILAVVTLGISTIVKWVFKL